MNANWLFIWWQGNNQFSLSGLGSTISATITWNILIIDNVTAVTGQISNSTSIWFGHFSNIQLWSSPWDLIPNFGWAITNWRSFMSNIGRILCTWSVFNCNAMWAVWSASTTFVHNVWEIRCGSLISWIDDLHNIKFRWVSYIETTSDTIICDPNLLSWRPIIEIDDCRIKSSWYIVRWTWWVGQWIKLNIIWGTTLESTQTENITWTANPANKVILMWLWVKSKRPRNSFGVVNDVVPDTLVNSAIDLWTL
jgi:hypothetical protein